jgi:hypothetical protein
MSRVRAPSLTPPRSPRFVGGCACPRRPVSTRGVTSPVRLRTCSGRAFVDRRPISDGGGRSDNVSPRPAALRVEHCKAPLAQLAEQLTLNQRVRGSSPWRRTRGPETGPFRLVVPDRATLYPHNRAGGRGSEPPPPRPPRGRSSGCGSRRAAVGAVRTPRPVHSRADRRRPLMAVLAAPPGAPRRARTGGVQRGAPVAGQGATHWPAAPTARRRDAAVRPARHTATVSTAAAWRRRGVGSPRPDRHLKLRRCGPYAGTYLCVAHPPDRGM